MDSAILRMVGGYMVRDAGTVVEPTVQNSRPCLDAAVRLACAISEVDAAAELEIVDLATGLPADEESVLEILAAIETEEGIR